MTWHGKVAQIFKPQQHKTDTGAFESSIDTSVEIKSSSWIALRCFEFSPSGRTRFAHTAPVHIDLPGKPLKPHRYEVEFLIKRVQDEIDRHRGVLSDRAMAEYEQALAAYKKLLENTK